MEQGDCRSRGERRTKLRTLDGRPLRRYKRRWKIERVFTWLYNFRRLVVRYEYHAANFFLKVQLGCAIILLRQFRDGFYQERILKGDIRSATDKNRNNAVNDSKWFPSLVGCLSPIVIVNCEILKMKL
jgi:hypothetical protein